MTAKTSLVKLRQEGFCDRATLFDKLDEHVLEEICEALLCHILLCTVREINYAYAMLIIWHVWNMYAVQVI